MSEALDLALPAVIDDKYRVGELLGEGAMGRVYSAEHVLLGHRVAIKFLRASMDTDTVRTRFVREAKATMALRSDHIVRVFDLGILASKTPYMVLEYLEGTDLRSLLDEKGALPVEEAVDYMLQACEALAEAHANGIIHRDLKPHNLFRTRLPNGSAHIKLLDFGVSKFEEHAPTDHELTTSQVLLGSPVFMSPEQIRSSSRVDARADVWSLGIVLYMLVGGGRPFDGDGLPALCASIMVDPPRPLASRCAAVPKELEAVIFRCLEKSRDARIANVVELARALEPFASVDGRLRAARIGRSYGSLLQRSAAPPSERVASSSPSSSSAAMTPTFSEHTATDARSAPTSLEAGGIAEGTSTALATRIVDATHASADARAERRRSRRAIGLVAGGAAAAVAVIAAAVVLAPRRPAPVSPPAPVVAAPEDAPPVAVSAALELPASAEPLAAPSSAPSTATGPLRSRRVAAPKRPPTTRTAPKNPAQVDRNGVPILD